MSDDQAIWKAQLAARLHDPPEKALILMRTPEGHEGGTSRMLMERLFPQGLEENVRRAVRRADRWASAADRAAFPTHDDDGRFPSWQNVRFHEQPVLIHPLTGESHELRPLTEIEPDHAKQLSLGHLQKLIVSNADGTPDLRRTALALWRFGPEIDAPEIRNIWAMLPADTRVPDHTIWDHLDLSVSLAASMAADPEGGPALLGVSIGPVQDFIAAARSTSDLWAGSHLLSRIAWEAMRVICEELGPESVLFPRLRGVPQVDVWLRDDCGLAGDMFENEDWARQKTDANPLFAAALPNRFTAIVPASRARLIGERISERVRQWAHARAQDAFRAMLKEAGLPDDSAYPAYDQIRTQLAGFPEVHWAAVPWSMVGTQESDRVDASDTRLAEAMRPFFQSSPPGYLGSAAWRLLSQEIPLEKGWFWHPNPGVLYPALHELLERVLAATKSVRPFQRMDERGWRCSLTGEVEWITTDREQLSLPPGKRDGTLWTRVAKSKPSWVKKGEHLGALPMLKRLWPSLFVWELKDFREVDVQRFVVSSHTMAVASDLARFVAGNRRVSPALRESVLAERRQTVSLPRTLLKELREHADREVLQSIPDWLDAEDEQSSDRGKARKLLEREFGHRPETYYGLMLMDGDRMGAWLSADKEFTHPHETAFHPQIRAGLSKFQGDARLAEYASSTRAGSPSWHMAISDALHNFAVRIVPAIVEGRYRGKLIYAGGDDVLAMLPATELLAAAGDCRAAYRGDGQDATTGSTETFRAQENGFVLVSGRLLRVMGTKADTSCGLVLAHHQAPLATVLRELRAAEMRAKTIGGRGAWSLSVVKRSGGITRVTEKWAALPVFQHLRSFLADPAVSRRAAYHTLEWLKDLPDDEAELLQSLLRYQFERQTENKTALTHLDVPGLAKKLTNLAFDGRGADSRSPRSRLASFVIAAEFLARETRDEVAGSALREGAML